MKILGGRLASLTFIGMCPFYLLSSFAQEVDTIKIGKETKKTVARVKGLQNGDIACSMELVDDKGNDFYESGEFEICFQKPSIIGKRVSLKYKIAKVQSEECQGNPDCKKSQTIALVTEARIIASGGVGVGTSKAAVEKSAKSGQQSFCTALEDVVFACRTGKKLISVCAQKNAVKGKGYL